MDNNNGDFIDQVRALGDATLLTTFIESAPENVQPLLKAVIGLLSKYGIKGKDALNFILDLVNIMNALDGLGLGPKGDNNG